MSKKTAREEAAVRVSERDRLAQLEREVIQLRKTNEVLLDRVEHRINVEGGRSPPSRRPATWKKPSPTGPPNCAC